MCNLAGVTLLFNWLIISLLVKYDELCVCTFNTNNMIDKREMKESDVGRMSVDRFTSIPFSERD